MRSTARLLVALAAATAAGCATASASAAAEAGVAAAAARGMCATRAGCDAAVEAAPAWMRTLLRDVLAARSEEAWAVTPSLRDVNKQWCPNNSFFEFIPVPMGSPTTAAPASWSSSCLSQMQATLSVASSGSPVATVTLSGSNPTSLLCSDAFIVATAYSARFVEVGDLNPNATVTIDSWVSGTQEAVDVAKNGVHIFVLPCGILGTVESAVLTASLFLGDGPSLYQRNQQFLMERGVYPTPMTNFGQQQYLPASILRNGNYLAIARFDGLDPMIMFGTGGRTGHSAVTVWEGNTLYVVESTDANPFGKVYWPPPYGVIRTPWDQWYQQAINASYHVDMLPIKPELAAQFNTTRFWSWFKTVQGMPYGYHNMLYSFMDTADPMQNFPQPIDTNVFTWVVNTLDRLIPASQEGVSVYSLFTQALNKRLGTSCQTIDCVLDALIPNGKNLGEAVAIPEQDEWMYGANYSMVCSVLAARAWQVGLGSALPSFEGSEQTPKDNYQMALFDPGFFNTTNCPIGLTNTPQGTYCQILGEFRMPLNGYNSIPLYTNMNNNCPAQWPGFVRCPANNPTCC